MSKILLGVFATLALSGCAIVPSSELRPSPPAPVIVMQPRQQDGTWLLAGLLMGLPIGVGITLSACGLNQIKRGQVASSQIVPSMYLQQPMSYEDALEIVVSHAGNKAPVLRAMLRG